MINGLPRILIVRLSAIGDVVRVLPALHALREGFPDAQIDWVVETKSAGIVEEHPCLDRVFVFERPPGRMAAARSFRTLCRQIRAGHYDIVLDFHGILKSGLISGFSGAPDRHGFARPRAQEGSWLFTNRKTRLPSPDLNRVEENLLLCDSLLPRRTIADVAIYVAEDVQESIDAFFEETFDAGKLVAALHAPVDRPEKQWPIENYAALADLLLADGRFDVLLTWGPGQREIPAEVQRCACRNPVVAPMTPDLKHLAWLLHRCDLYFGGDTGPMHVAAAMDTPVAAVFGGTDPRKHAPYERSCEILYADPEMRLSPKERLARTTPEMAFDTCVRLLARHRRMVVHDDELEFD